jgi:hypothetical protein
VVARVLDSGVRALVEHGLSVYGLDVERLRGAVPAREESPGSSGRRAQTVARRRKAMLSYGCAAMQLRIISAPPICVSNSNARV